SSLSTNTFNPKYSKTSSFSPGASSAPVLNGTTIDFKQSLMGGGFQIDNPNAIASCGCGSSFRTAKVAGNPENC
ncbi:HesB/IscA family protein, partial [Staphylococcus aureus]|uniref:HesB/IscA family protein n=1 Tax=Staphylococcus aureus TaxID=1280 RepID=UPI001F5B8C69